MLGVMVFSTTMLDSLEGLVFLVRLYVVWLDLCWLLAARAGCLAREVTLFWMFKTACFNHYMLLPRPALVSLHGCLSVVVLTVVVWCAYG
jgi:hypothetical protein